MFKYRGSGDNLLVCAFNVGDHVLMKRTPDAVRSAMGVDKGVSTRLLPLASSIVYEVYKTVGPKTVILCDPDTRSTELQFSQPVSTDRLIPFSLCALDVPIEEAAPVEVEVRVGQGDA